MTYSVGIVARRHYCTSCNLHFLLPKSEERWGILVLLLIVPLLHAAISANPCFGWISSFGTSEYQTNRDERSTIQRDHAGNLTSVHTNIPKTHAVVVMWRSDGSFPRHHVLRRVRFDFDAISSFSSLWFKFLPKRPRRILNTIPFHRWMEALLRYTIH